MLDVKLSRLVKITVLLEKKTGSCARDALYSFETDGDANTRPDTDA
jgi:hypothetical protein